MSVIVAKRIENILKEGGFDHEIMDHGPVFTSEEAANIRGVSLKSGVKALLLKTTDGGFVMGLCPGDKRLDLKKIAKKEGVKKASLASKEEVLKITGCEIGSVPPFGYPKKLKTYMDRDVLENEWVNFNIGLHTKSASMKSADLRKLVNPVLM
jgi:Ala-tRNA(Pro) deacylase